MTKFILVIFCILSLQVVSSLASQVASEGDCINGDYHKASPSPETKDFATCHAFKENSCCTAEFTVELMANEAKNLYNHSWHRCGQLSEKCQQFWIKQECFYQCSPDVYKYASKSIKGAIIGVPVCSGFCDDWFEACKMDQICVENVLSDYNFTVHGENFCPANKNCTTYEMMYRNGANLCEKMWGGSYIYTKPNADFSNCLMMDGSNKVFSSKAYALLVILLTLAVIQ
ncbi:riboflavin-binding protein-like isoform X1 [Montipora foliosa]|uniref:riboflavin-binding protein-like isoform X1 n=1 Tax=Montipora foliosa TaxID=591990 RepID=UPI0035F1ECE8